MFLDVSSGFLTPTVKSLPSFLPITVTFPPRLIIPFSNEFLIANCFSSSQIKPFAIAPTSKLQPCFFKKTVLVFSFITKLSIPVNLFAKLSSFLVGRLTPFSL